MKTKWIAAAAAALAMGCATGAQAGIYTDDLSRCLVAKTTEQDKNQLVRWIFTIFAMNPAVKDIVNLTPAQREQYNRGGADLLQRLLIDDCHKETVAAIKYEGSAAMGASFQVLGQVAARGLMTDPSVLEGLQSLTTYLDKSRWTALAKEAGTPIDLAK